MKTTLNEIRKHSPCKSIWEKLLTHLNKTKADDEPLDLMTILESNGIHDAIWCLRCFDYKDYCLLNADVAESVLPIFEAKHPNDNRPKKAIESIRLWKNKKITDKKLKSAYAAADAAAAYAAAVSTDADAYAAADAAYASAATDAFAAVAAAYAAYAHKKQRKIVEKLFIKHFS